MNLDEIYREYQTLGLGGRNGTSTNFVPGDGPVPAKIMIVGEAPGEKEDKIGKPFQGPSGLVLNDLLGFVHVKREDVFVTNVFKYRPPGNRDPFSSEIISSLPCLSAEIKCVDPRVIILAGKIACTAFFPNKTARSLRGQVIKKGTRKIIVTYHPAALLRSREPMSKAMIRSDFELAARLSKEPI